MEDWTREIPPNLNNSVFLWLKLLLEIANYTAIDHLFFVNVLTLNFLFYSFGEFWVGVNMQVFMCPVKTEAGYQFTSFRAYEYSLGSLKTFIFIEDAKGKKNYANPERCNQ